MQAETPALSFNHIHNTDTSILATTAVMGKNKDTEVDKVAGVATDDDVGKSEIKLEHMSAWGSETVPGCWVLDSSSIGEVPVRKASLEHQTRATGMERRR